MREPRSGRDSGAGLASRSPHRGGRVAIVSVACLLLLTTGFGLADDGGFSLPLPDNPFEGRTQFESKHCSRCHGITGAEAGVGPSLGRGGFEGTFLELGAGLWNHVPGMSVTIESAGLEWPQLSGDEVREVLVFLYALEYLGRPGDPERGQRLFDARGCASCHAIGGGPAIGPDLSAMTSFASPLYVAQQIWNHGPSMFDRMRVERISRPSFEPGDLADLSAFLRQRSQRPPQAESLTPPGNPNAGMSLFSSKGCASCHGEDARGGAIGPDLSRADLHLSAEAIAGSMWNHGLEMLDTMRTRGIGWPAFADSELADLVAYLYFLPFTDPAGDAGRGERVFAERSCSRCHDSDPSSNRLLEVEAPGLVGAMGEASPSDFVAALWNHAPVMREAILAAGEPWPDLSARDMRDLLAYLRASEGSRSR